MDPLDIVWTATARRLGLRIARSDEVFASTDGRGTLTLGAPSTLDPDDHLAQLVLHEICHWIVNGADAIHQVDWGFDPMEGLDWREYPTLRLQRVLAQEHGLVRQLAPTTAARAYWDRLQDPTQPLDDSPLEARIVERARQSISRSRQSPWEPALSTALAATARLHRAVDSVSGHGVLVPISPPGASPSMVTSTS